MGNREQRNVDVTAAVLVYDGDCPVCSSYVRYVRIRDAVGTLHLVDGRQGGPWLTRVREAGLNLDQGMVLFYGGRAYHAQDSMHMLALMSSKVGLFNRINALIFRNKLLARVLYPGLRFGRNMILIALGRSKLNVL
jgi:predicted DCC family thiol-disulfide oxidoreductase YuxK